MQESEIHENPLSKSESELHIDARHVQNEQIPEGQRRFILQAMVIMEFINQGLTAEDYAEWNQLNSEKVAEIIGNGHGKAYQEVFDDLWQDVLATLPGDWPAEKKE